MTSLYRKISNRDFMSIYQRVPRLAVDVVVTTPQGFVLTKRSIEPYLGMWHIPGGTVLFKEPISHSISRVSLEELGVRVKVKKMLGIIEYFNDGGRHTVTLCYLTTIKSGHLKGSYQGEDFACFKKIPPNTITEQAVFLKKHLSQILGK